jgi:hypothetical protein
VVRSVQEVQEVRSVQEVLEVLAVVVQAVLILLQDADDNYRPLKLVITTKPYLP